jgi:hypothetical protein
MSDTGNQPMSTNSTATTADVIIQNANSAIIQLVMTLAIADQPWLGWPVIKTVFSLALGWVDGYLSKAEQTGATFLIIDTQVSSEETAISRAIAAVSAAQKTGDKNALQKAIQDYANAQSALINNNGSATPK